MMSCDWVDRRSPVGSQEPALAVSPERPQIPLTEQGITRWDSQWWSASDEELEATIEDVGGRVSIGFKNHGAEAGVDIRGRVLASDRSVQDGLAMLAGRDIEIVRESRLIPSVSAVIDPADVPFLRSHPLIDYIEPVANDYELHGNHGGLRVADSMWAAEAIQAHLAWDSTTGTGVTIGVTDSGIDLNHPDLSPLSVHDCTGGNGQDGLGHGTEVTGMIAAAANGTGMTGAAHGASIRVYRLYDIQIDSASFDLLECAVDEAVADGVDVINISLGRKGGPVVKVVDAISAAYWGGTLIVASAGNDSDTLAFPASMWNVMAVGAVDKNLEVVDGSPVVPQIDVVAPGVSADSAIVADSILTTCLTITNSDYCAAPGKDADGNERDGNEICVTHPTDPSIEYCENGPSTSIAAALVSSVAALIKSQEPSLSPYAIRNRLRASADPLGSSVPNDSYGYGIVQALDALELDMPPEPQITISGPTSIQPEATCTWTAQITDGLSPYSDPTWYVHSHVQVGTGYEHTGGEPGGNTRPDFNLFFEVTDYVGRTGSEEIIVELDEGAPPCLI